MAWSTYLQAFAYVSLLFFFVPVRIPGKTEVEMQFRNYLEQFNKSYNDPDIYQRKLQAFMKSLEMIQILNANQSSDSAEYGLTKFSDMLPEEFAFNHLSPNLGKAIIERKTNRRHERASVTLPNKIDWRDKKVVTKIRNQGNCGACWAFSAIETLESMDAIKTGKLTELSVQQMIDCAGYNNNGCKGGDICNLLSWMKDNSVRVHLETEYPLSLTNEKCRMNASFPGVQVGDFVCESLVGNEDVILELLVRNGPLAVAINARTWQNYIGGVIQYHCDGDITHLNHAVQIVGYDMTSRIPHYIVRNTWGNDFGDEGYLYLAIGKNICGLANEVSALTVL